MTQYIKKLPAVFQTVTEKKFFDATFDQVFSKKDSDLLNGFLGRRDPGSYNPITDFYLPEVNKNRTWWQLEATAFARTEDSTKSNIFFYEDLLNRIDSLGGNTLNQDRLFESEYYSWAPPIDFDMFINYQNYYWIDQGLAAINITGVVASDIIGQASYTTPPSATPPNVTLTTGMTIVLVDDPNYQDPHTVENIGNCVGIRLVPQFSDYTAGTVFEFLPWDGVIELSNGRVITNLTWDTTTWDTQTQPGNSDYITIERGSVDRNAWSRTNKWFNIQTINQVVALTGTSFPTNATRALRPIIQFIADLPLYKSGTQFRSEIQFGLRDDAIGNPLLFANYQGQTTAYFNSTLSITVNDGDLFVFMNDTSSFDLYGTFLWDVSGDNWDNGVGRINSFIFQANIQLDGTVLFTPYTSYSTPVVSGDIIFVTEDAPYDGALRGQTWYYEANVWQQAYNDKVTTNQPPLFQLYDHNGTKLDDTVTYPESDFTGSKIFSYKVNTEPGATVDPVLKFPIVYSSLGQTSDIIFENNLIVNRYTYSTVNLPINGYYYYKTAYSPVLYNDWNLYDLCDCNDIAPPPPCNCIEKSKQRVIDKFVIGYGSQYQFKLSVTPYGYPATPDLIVSVNGVEVKSAADQTNGYTFVEINNNIYVVLTAYISTLLLTPQSQPPVVEVQTYTHDLLDPLAAGYFEIPQQLEANPTNGEIGEISAGNLIQQFSSIISNQIGFTGVAFGGNNNYKDSRKNRSVGSYILQNVAPALKSMLVSSSDDLDFIAGIRFSADEYTKFKNKFMRVAKQLIDQGFNPTQYHNNTISTSEWTGEIIRILSISKEFSNAFAYSYMIANGAPDTTQNVAVPGSRQVVLANYLDLSNPQNTLYIYDTTGSERILMLGRDYSVTSTTSTITVNFTTNIAIGDNVYFYLYRNPLPAYIPSTPTKVGTYPTYIPRIELDTSYAIPTNVIIGHDGSKTIAYGDYRDQLLLDFETRIYNLLYSTFLNQYSPPLRIESVRPGHFRQTRYSRQEYLDITESYINKWSAKNRANYRVNDWPTLSPVTPVGQLWKLYNYSDAKNTLSQPLNLPGNWKGIFQYYYDTIYPDTRPWEMLGFSSQPSWWVTQYGTNWSSTNALLWADLEAGLIRQGPSAIYDPETLMPLPQEMWARPGLSAIIPVDASGNIIPVPTLFSVAMSGNPYAPFDGFDSDWMYGDGSPVEQAWMSTSGYAFEVQEFLYLMRPGPFGELCWDTVGTTLSPGMLTIGGVNSPVQSSKNWQYVQNETYTDADPFFAWMRPKNADQLVHAESVDGVIQVRYGYQRWISDRILFLGKDITSTFGQKIRTLDVNLANKFGGFTNKDTTTTYIESVSPGATNGTLLVPTNNFEVVLHKSPPVDIYAYSGIVIRALADGTFAIYGYDLQNSEFVTFNRSSAKLIDVSIGGTPAEFSYFTAGATYSPGDIVRYNGVYYSSLVTQTSDKFNSDAWQKLKALPTIGGVSVVYKPVSEPSITRYPYGSIIKTAQEVFDIMIGYGAYLEARGWDFTQVNQDTNQVADWLYSAKQFLFWLNTQWAPDASIQLSPLSNTATLTVAAGYPNDVENIYNGVYSILDKYGVAIPPDATVTDREGQKISVSPSDLTTGGIYFLQVTASETEHVLIFDNTTSFNDVIYSPLLRERQQRLRFTGFRSNGWYGKMEAPGYLVIDNQLVPNFDTIVDSMRYYYDPNVTIDNPSIEELGRHLIGYESKSYLDNLEVSNDVQYLFYQGAIRQKGTKQAFDKLFRSTKIQNNEVIEVFEEWALKLGEFGNTIEQVSTEFKLVPEQNTGEVIVARLNFVPSSIGTVRQINVLNAENTYKSVPKVLIPTPDASPTDPRLTQPLRQAKAYIVLDSTGRIARVDMTDIGYGYLSAPIIDIDSGSESHALDKLFSVWQGEIIKDVTPDNIINIDIDQTDVWTVRPEDPSFALEFPVTDRTEYGMPTAGYVNFNDVDLYSFDASSASVTWGDSGFNPVEGNSLWIANTFTQDWDVYKLVKFTGNFAVIDGGGGNLQLLTSKLVPMITPQFSTSGNVSDFGDMISLQVIEATATAVIDSPGSQAGGTVDIINPVVAALTSTVSSGGVSSLTITDPGLGYLSTPTITIDPPTKETATMAATVVNGVVTSVNITNNGLGYASATVSVAPPTLINATATATVTGNSVSALTLAGHGAGYVSAPVVAIESPQRQSVASAELSSGTITGVTMVDGGSGYISTPAVTIAAPLSITATGTVSFTDGGGLTIGTGVVTNHGAGYITAPLVTVSGDGTGANMTATIANGIVTALTVTSAGTGYYTVNISIAAPAGGVTATANAVVSNGKVTEIIITSPGAGYAAEPQITIAAPTGVTATAHTTIANAEVESIVIDNAGSGYAFVPSVSIEGPTGTTATVSPTVVAGVITGLTFTGGSGYSTAPVITVSQPNGVQATAIATVPVVGEGIAVSSFTAGSGYAIAPNVTVSYPTGAGYITNPGVTEQGFGYTSDPAVTINGNGSGATSHSVRVGDKITGIVIDNPGVGYSFANVVIDPPNGIIGDIVLDKVGANYTVAPVVTINGDGVGATARATIAGGVVTGITITNPGSGYTVATVDIASPESVGGDTNYALRFSYNNTDSAADADYYHYDLLTIDDTPVTTTDVPDYHNFTKLMLFKTLRFFNVPLIPSYLSANDKIWVDDSQIDLSKPTWSVFTYTGSQFVLYREQQPLINSSLFQSATVYSTYTSNQLVQLPVYDPFKGILPGLAKQNITYMSLQDPARYNVTSNERLKADTITFGPAQVGQLWWDLAQTRYVYYEQPIAFGETEVDNLVYRRNHWGQIFPGSTVAIYEWIESDVPPSQYKGTGIPRDLTSYVQLVTSNRFTNVTEIKYYFWALGTTNKPNLENRTLAAVDVSRLLQSPKSQQYSFFAPVQQTNTNNSYMFYNVQEILAYQGNNVQIQYRIGERDDQKHTQWAFFREGDTSSLVTDQFWNKMVDSICAYTQPLPISDAYNNGIQISPTTEIFPVPDLTLSSGEKYGIQYRPRQGMFANITNARKVFVQAANSLLQYIPIRDNNPDWNIDVPTSIYWKYTNWFEPGYETATPDFAYQTLAEANAALLTGNTSVGKIVKVLQGTPDGRYIYYVVQQINPNIPTLSYNEVVIENSAIKLLDTVYTVNNVYGLSTELRQLLNAFRTQVMVDNYLVDQNELFFAMMNYVVSEQRNPNWLFKSSYIYIKENNQPLQQNALYIPNQIQSVIDYIMDAKPYHTQIRDYTSTHKTTDVAVGTANDGVTAILREYVGWDIGGWDSISWNESFVVSTTVIKPI